MTTTETTLKFLRPQAGHRYPHRDMEIMRVIKRDESLRASLFIDRETGLVRSKYENHPHLKTLTNSDGRTIFCSPELYNFALQVREVMPYVDFYIEDHSFDNFHDMSMVSTLHVYRPGDVKTMGIIGYGHTGLISGRRPKWDAPVKNNYIVHTPYIRNNKYREDSTAHFMLASKNVTTAMKNVKKFLRPWSPVDIACSYRPYFEGKVQAKVSALRMSIHRLEYGLDRHVSDMAQLIRDLVDKKVDKVMDANLQDKIDKFLAEKEVLQQEVSKSLVSTFVLVRPNGTVDTLTFGADSIEDEIMCRSTAVKTYSSVDELPEELQSAISVMSMLDSGEYVEGVGMKTNDRTYWIHHEEN